MYFDLATRQCLFPCYEYLKIEHESETEKGMYLPLLLFSSVDPLFCLRNYF